MSQGDGPAAHPNPTEQQSQTANPGGDTVSEDSLKLFPERRGQYSDRGFFARAFLGDESRQRNKCERFVIQAIESSPLVRLMMKALSSSGCPIDPRRHITCEWCSSEVTGGYDPTLNQIVVCYNRCQKGMIQGILAHEMLHMFDHCRAHMDFKNPEHIACSEVRAANLMHCSILSGMTSNTVSPFNLSKAHQQCVRQKAAASVMTAMGLDWKEAFRVTDKVFDKCYNDLEPVGRRCRARSNDPERAYRERYLYGYD